MNVLVGQNKYKKLGTAVNATFQEHHPNCNFRHACHRFARPAAEERTEFLAGNATKIFQRKNGKLCDSVIGDQTN